MSVAKRIGIVGLGLMGSALAQRLLEAGYAVLGFDIDREKRPALEKSAEHLPAPSRTRTPMHVDVPRRFQHRQVEAVVEHDFF